MGKTIRNSKEAPCRRNQTLRGAETDHRYIRCRDPLYHMPDDIPDWDENYQYDPYGVVDDYHA